MSVAAVTSFERSSRAVALRRLEIHQRRLCKPDERA